MAGIGAGLTVTDAVSVSVQPLLLVTVTVYVVVDTGETVIAELLPKPPDQRYVPMPEAVRVVLLPTHIPVTPLITATGEVQTPIWAEALLVQPFTPVTVTVYIVADTGETVTAELLPSPPDQR
jgi:hypothetical protein